MFDAVAPAAPPENWLIAAICTMGRLGSRNSTSQADVQTRSQCGMPHRRTALVVQQRGAEVQVVQAPQGKHRGACKVSTAM